MRSRTVVALGLGRPRWPCRPLAAQDDTGTAGSATSSPASRCSGRPRRAPRRRSRTCRSCPATASGPTPPGAPSSSSPTGRSCASTAAASSTTPATRRDGTSASSCACGPAARSSGVRSRGFARFEIETPAGMVQALERGIVRVDVDAGETRVSVYDGEAVLDDGRRQVRLAAGERTFARWGDEAGRAASGSTPARPTTSPRWDGRASPRTAGRRTRPRTCPTSSTPTRASSSERRLALRGHVRVRLGSPRRGRLAALLERPLDLDALRLDLGALRALGLGAVPLRPLGLLGVVRLVLGAGPHVGAGRG